jgi:hypothetical protein
VTRSVTRSRNEVVLNYIIPVNTCVSYEYMTSNTTVILDGVLFYHGHMFRRLTGPSSGCSGGLHGYYQSLHYHYSVTSVHERLGSRTIFRAKKRLGLRTVSRITNMQTGNSGWRQAESIGVGVSVAG